MMYHTALTPEGTKLFPKLKQFADFYLAGGTGLALQLGHRISVDFDLFSGADIEKELLRKVKRIFSESVVSPLVNNLEELSVLVDGVKLAFLKYPFPVLNDLVDFAGLKSLSILETAATKAYTIGRRGLFKDYVDLYFVLSEKHGSLERVIQLAEKKFSGEFNSRLFLEQLIYLEDIEETALVFLKDKVNKKQLGTYFTEMVKQVII